MEQRTDHVANMAEERLDLQKLDKEQKWCFEERLELLLVVGNCTCIEKLLAHFATLQLPAPMLQIRSAEFDLPSSAKLKKRIF